MSDILSNILVECIAIEKQIRDFYNRIAKSSKDERIKKFWISLTKDKDRFISHLHKISVYIKQGVVPQIFSYPFELLKELESINDNLKTLLDVNLEEKDIEDIIFLAYFSEFQVINEAFAVFYQMEIPGTKESIENDIYGYHSRFFKMTKNFSKDKLKYILFGNTLKRLWNYITHYVRSCEVDYLTGVLSRQGILQKVSPWIEMLVREKRPISVILIDVDGMKGINETYDYKEGDKVLKFVAGEIKNICRKSDIAGRFAGDEFLIFIPFSEKKNIEKIAERIRKRIEEKSANAGLQSGKVTVSVGGVLGKIENRRRVEDSFQKFIDFAESLLQKIKKTGGNGSAVFKMDNIL